MMSLPPEPVRRRAANPDPDIARASVTLQSIANYFAVEQKVKEAQLWLLNQD
jgi:hypothetical protein